ncbi:MAG: hypothetical protein K8S56_08250 [Candidatus Cloacimonetes bacterium]|nr:hypothetical protein [Candidatus Cloacimonadota bacterium]
MLKGKVREFGPWLLYTVLTMGIYYIWWTFAVLREIETSFKIEHDHYIKSARSMLILRLVILLVSTYFIVASPALGIETTEAQNYDRFFWLNLLNVVVAGIFYYRFTLAIAFGQFKAGLEPFRIFDIFGFMLASLIMGFFTSFLTVFFYASIIFSLIFHFKLLKEINRIWLSDQETTFFE